MTATHYWRTSSGPLHRSHDVLLLDLDGVVYLGPRAVPGACEAIAAVRRVGTEVAFVTNNAARSADAVARHLAALGVPARSEDVVTSAQAAGRLLAGQLPAGAPVLCIGTDDLAAELTTVGLRPVRSMADGPTAVVQGFSPQTSWASLDEACAGVRAGLPWVATNLDLTLPTSRGPAPGNGAFVQLVRAVTGRTPTVVGKPYRPLLDEAVGRTSAQRPLFVGDRLDTDVAGAVTAGMPALLVLTGISSTSDLLLATVGERPQYLAADLPGLLLAAPAVTWRDDTCCADTGTGDVVRARWVAGADDRQVLEVTGPVGAADDPAPALAAIRAGCAAAWQRADQGGDRATRTAVDLAQLRTALSPWTARYGWDR